MTNETHAPKFTQKHYEFMADMVSRVKDPTTQHSMAFILADDLEKDNPKFNRVKFLVKCIPSLRP